MFCSKCGAANVDDAVVCKSCATAITLALTSGNRLIAAGLSLVVPGLGQGVSRASRSSQMVRQDPAWLSADYSKTDSPRHVRH